MDKECKTCKRTLPEENFWVARKNKITGIIYRKPSCKDCMSNSKANKPNKPRIKKDSEITKNEITMPRINKEKPFTDKEIETIKLMIQEYNSRSEIKEVSNNDLIEILKTKSSRTKTIINLDEKIRKQLKEFESKNNINMSDSVNYILSKYFRK